MQKLYTSRKSSGQAYVEVVVTLGLVMIVMSVIVTGTVNGLRSANFSSQKSQATTLAREGLELARRDRDQGYADFAGRITQSTRWCIDKSGVWTAAAASCPANIDSVFTRLVELNQRVGYIEVISTVTWREGSQTRQSKVETRLTNWR